MAADERRHPVQYLKKVLTLRREKYDLVIDIMAVPVTVFTTRLTGARWQIGFDTGKWRSRLYKSRVPHPGHLGSLDGKLKLLDALPVPAEITRDMRLTLLPDEKDHYVNALRRNIRHGEPHYLMDRLLIAGIVEARGAERFGLIAEALPKGELKRFYQSITRSELAHEGLFLKLARQYFDSAEVRTRLDELLEAEAAVVIELPFRLALH